MAKKRGRKQSSWIWKYCTKENDVIKCDICPSSSYVCSNTSNFLYIKRHLFRIHGICEDISDRTSLIWQYFTEQGKYTFICRICNYSLSAPKFNLVHHLERWHLQKIAEVQEEFQRLRISHHFISHTGYPERMIYCKSCYKMFDIFAKIKLLTNHLLEHGINESSHTEGINMNITTQSVAEENNVDTTFHETTHLQAEENYYNAT